MKNRFRFNLGRYLPYLINRAGAALVARFTAEALARERLSIAMWRVLAVLSHNGAQRQIDLARLTSIDTSTLSRLITRLARRGLVSRRRSKSSNREVLVCLSGKGRATVAALIPIARRLERAASAGLAAKEITVLRRSLTHMYENLAR